MLVQRGLCRIGICIHHQPFLRELVLSGGLPSQLDWRSRTEWMLVHSRLCRIRISICDPYEYLLLQLVLSCGLPSQLE